MEIRKPKEWETFPEIREVKNTEEVREAKSSAETKNRKEEFTMLKGSKDYTIADIESLPEGERAELIDGELFRMDAPMTVHQKILIELAYEIKRFIKNKRGNCEVLPAPFAVSIKKDNRNYVEPDISVICDRDKLDEKGCQGAPDWMIEIVSPSSKIMDYDRKVALYREAGARLYWIVDPEMEMVTVYDFEHGRDAVQYSFSEKIKAEIFEELYLDLSEMDLG